MSEVTILQTLQYQALQRAIGEMNAALETMREDDAGEYPLLAKVIEDCITKLKDNM
ncbi:TPA: hypothetical protein PXN07_004066 [Yersinia enterocolitica]|uniref:hypothetical protein n=1 Tax=Yersinia sp. LJYL362 TaxID=3402108 RepID=UPI00285B0DA4|nr:hypothetical protein [Yersinia enterocolitica]HDL7338758.1 hypothetical protein [Yersinia enterocolitica]HDV7153744.1 hypothetical protein [Yersinia enterocolitica]